MKISFSPMRSDAALELSTSGDVLTINSEQLDFSQVPEGATLPKDAVDNAFLASDVERINGELCLTLILPQGVNAGPEMRFPETITTTGDGPVMLPNKTEEASQ